MKKFRIFIIHLFLVGGIFVISFSSIYVYKTKPEAKEMMEYFNDKEKKKELEKKNIQSELNLLRSQINPHFLFNTLNNIDALIRKNPEKASNLLIKLSVQMRYMLYDSNTERIDLSSEIEFINDYISLQKLRIKNQNAVKINLNDILYIQGMKDYLMILSDQSKIMTLQSFKEIEKVLTEPAFVRIHKSYMIALGRIESIERNCIKIADQLLPIGDTYRDHFYEILRKNKHLI